MSFDKRAERELANVHRLKKSDEERLTIWSSNQANRFSMAELHTPPDPMEFVIEELLPLGCVAVATGAGGTSKTSVMALQEISIAAGLPFFGRKVMPGAVLHVSAEDRRPQFLRQIYSNTRHLSDLQLAAVSERLFVKDIVGLGFKLTWSVEGRTRTADDVGQLVEFANDIPDLRLIVLDTLSRLNGGEETNEDLARFVEAMEFIARETGAAVQATHHAGKAQTRGDTNDQYSGRGGSALSDNARSVMHIARVTAETNDAPSNADKLIADGRLLRLSRVKANYASPVFEDIWIERVITPHAAQLMQFQPEFSNGDAKAIWEKLQSWFVMQTDVRYPSTRSVDALGKEFGSRAERRRAIDWALDRSQLVELDHPNPKAGRKKYLALASAAHAESAREYRSAKDGQ